MPGAEAADGRVVDYAVVGDDPERAVLGGAPLDLARRADADRIGVKEQSGHHARVVGGPAQSVVAVGR